MMQEQPDSADSHRRREEIMGALDDVGNILKQYTQGGTPAPADVATHFDQVAKAVPTADLADGVAHAIRSDQTPPFGQIVSNMFNQADGAQKAGMLNQLVSALGPGAAAAVGGGALADMLSKGTTATAADAQKVSPDMVQQLADRAHSADGSIVDKLSGFYAQHPTLVKSLGAGALALVMSKLSNRR